MTNNIARRMQERNPNLLLPLLLTITIEHGSKANAFEVRTTHEHLHLAPHVLAQAISDLALEIVHRGGQ